MLEAIRNFNRTGGYYSAVSSLVDEAREQFDRAAGECYEIVVAPPQGKTFDDAFMCAKISAALKGEFPHYVWHVTADGPPRENHFVVLPLLGSTSTGLLRAPPDALLRDAIAFLNATFDAPQHH
jgi:hypothetical protein